MTRQDGSLFIQDIEKVNIAEVTRRWTGFTSQLLEYALDIEDPKREPALRDIPYGKKCETCSNELTKRVRRLKTPSALFSAFEHLITCLHCKSNFQKYRMAYCDLLSTCVRRNV